MDYRLIWWWCITRPCNPPQRRFERLCDPEAEVSAHYVIAQDGALTQLVDEADRAWHAGAGQWGWVTDVNSHSIGIELDNSGRDMPFPEGQMRCLERLLVSILDRHKIPAERVIGHSDMAPGRKQDPGPCFDWKRLAEKGLSVWANPGADGGGLGCVQIIGVLLWLPACG